MPTPGLPETCEHATYDVVIIGGAMMGAAVAWFLADTPGFQGRVLVIERDPAYEFCSTTRSASCLRQQFSSPLNIRVSQFAAGYIRNFRRNMGDDPRVPDILLQSFGYMYLADSAAAADALRAGYEVQKAAGVGTRLLSPDQIAADYPFYNLDDIVLGRHNPIDEGYWDSGSVFDWWRRMARGRGVEFVAGEAVAMTRDKARIAAVTLANGDTIGCGHVVNATGPRAALTARMAGLDIPVEPRKRFTWVFTAQTPLDGELPLTIDPSGVYVRQDGPQSYVTGTPPDPDPAVAPDDFTMDHSLWQSRVWPVLAHRIPQFEAIRVVNEWVGHYAFNPFDQNAILGPDPEVPNFLYINGFSGHGLQQAPAMGRGLAEWLAYGDYRSLDLRPFHVDRIRAGRRFEETAII